MPDRRLRAVVCCVVAGAALVGSPAVAAAAAKPVTLTATATFPGVPGLQRHVVRLSSSDLAGYRVTGRPDAASVVVVDRRTRAVRRHGKRVRIAAPSCVRATLSIALLPGAGDALTVARGLLPQAQEEALWAGSPEGEALPADGSAGVAYRLYRDRSAREAERRPDAVRELIDVFVSPTSTAPRGWAVGWVRAERLRRSGACAVPHGRDDEPLLSVELLGMSTLVLLADERS